jgi:hypothetical protein
MNHKFGRLIYAEDDKNIEILKTQCEAITESIVKIFSLEHQDKIDFDVVINQDKFSIPTFVCKNKKKVINYPKKNLEKLELEGFCPDLIHEIIHTLWFCKDKIFLSEGIAVGISYYLSLNTYYPFSLDVKHGTLFQNLVYKLPRDIYLKLKSLKVTMDILYLSNCCKQDFGISQQHFYAISGSFILFLIEEYGAEKLGQLLFLQNLSFEKVYSLSEKEMLKQWLDSCLQIMEVHKKFSVSKNILNLLSCDWVFNDDSKLGGSSKISFKKDNNGLLISGTIGNGAVFNGFAAGAILISKNKEVMKFSNITIELSGSDIEAQIFIVTKDPKDPGTEPIYMLLCKPEFTKYIIPLNEFKSFFGISKKIVDNDIKAIGCRILGNPDRKFEICIKQMYVG